MCGVGELGELEAFVCSAGIRGEPFFHLSFLGKFVFFTPTPSGLFGREGGNNSGVTVWMREKRLTVEMDDGGLHGETRMLRKIEANDVSNSMFEPTSFNMEIESWVCVSPLGFFQPRMMKNQRFQSSITFLFVDRRGSVRQ